MCFFKAPSPTAPTVVYSGPSDSDIAANKAALDTYQSQMAEQQKTFQAALQKQIDDATASTTKLEADLATELEKAKTRDAAEAAAAATAGTASAYAVTASESEAPASAETTTATKKKEKPKSSLRISTAGLPSSSGTGLSIGV